MDNVAAFIAANCNEFFQIKSNLFQMAAIPGLGGGNVNDRNYLSLKTLFY